MWYVEARKFGENKDYFYMSGLTQKEARRRHSELSNSGKWAMVHSWDMQAQWEQEQANQRIRDWKTEMVYVGC